MDGVNADGSMVKRSGGALTFRPEKRRLAPDPGAPESPRAGQ